MNVAKIMAERQRSWDELERLCEAMQWRGRTSKVTGRGAAGAEGIAKFASLYRSACADLALASSYQLPPATEAYLHRLVARAHNQLYRSESLSPQTWAQTIFSEAPRRIFNDPCVRIAAIVFYGLFALALVMGRAEDTFPNFAASVVTQSGLDSMEEMYEAPIEGSLDHYVSMAAFYIKHNTGIGLVCFGLGILILPCAYQLVYNAILLGASFGYMARPDIDGGDHFFEFVTAHGPSELTAIVLAAAAGLKLGVGVVHTRGLRRSDSLRAAAIDGLPVIAASAALFVMAAFTEGFISPSPLPYLIKCLWAIMSSGLISFYIVVLGFPRHEMTQLLFPAAKDSLWDEDET